MNQRGSPVGFSCRPVARSWATIARKSGSKRYDWARPSNSDANREIPIATTTPPGTTTRRASRQAASRSARSVRWYSGPSSSTTSDDASGSPSARASPTSALNPSTGAEPFPRARDVTGHDVDQVHPVAVGEQPLGVHPRRATDVEHARCRRHVPTHDLLHPRVLEASDAAAQPEVLVEAGLVVLVDRARCRLGHRVTIRRAGHLQVASAPSERSGA